MGGSIRRHRRNRTSKVRVGIKKNPHKEKVVAIGDHVAEFDNKKRTLIENYAGARLATTVNGPAGVPKGAHGRAPPVAAPEHDGAELELEPDHVFGPDADAVTKREMAKVLNKNAGAEGEGRHVAPLTSRQKRVVAALVEAHGDDYAAMARDLRRNPLQHTPAKLRGLCLSYAATKHQTIGLGGARPTRAQRTTFHPQRRF